MNGSLRVVRRICHMYARKVFPLVWKERKMGDFGSYSNMGMFSNWRVEGGKEMDFLGLGWQITSSKLF